MRLAEHGRDEPVATLSRVYYGLDVERRRIGACGRDRGDDAGVERPTHLAQQSKTAAVTADIRATVATLPDTLLGIRDRALLLLGFAGAFRRSDLVTLDVQDLEFTRAGLVVTQRRSKTDQEGEGRKLGIPHGANPDTCPVRAVQEWLDVSDLKMGPLFRGVNRHEQMRKYICDGQLFRENAAAMVGL